MRYPFLRRLANRPRSGAFLGAVLTATGAAAMSCSSDRAEDPLTTPDAGQRPDAQSPVADAATEDAGHDADSSIEDASRIDASPLGVTCPSGSCATSLTTTLTGEGFCALLSDRTVACWGENGSGQLGRGEVDAGDDTLPARVTDLGGVTALEHTCAIDGSGGVWCWGEGPYLRSTTTLTTIERTPVNLEIPAVTQLGVSATTACAMTASGVVCWGSNAQSQIAPRAPGESVPTTPLLPTPITFAREGQIRGIFVGDATFVLFDDGTVLSWGGNPPLGRVSSLVPDPYPAALALQDIHGFAAAASGACALVGGVTYCWGTLLDAQLTDPRLPKPVALPEIAVQVATTPPEFAIPQRACVCAASGSVYCWGTNTSGQAGDGTTANAPKPVKVAGLPGPAAQVRATATASCALLTNGKIYCWGEGSKGQLGSGKADQPSLTPKEVVLP